MGWRASTVMPLATSSPWLGKKLRSMYECTFVPRAYFKLSVCDGVVTIVLQQSSTLVWVHNQQNLLFKYTALAGSYISFGTTFHSNPAILELIAITSAPGMLSFSSIDPQAASRLPIARVCFVRKNKVPEHLDCNFLRGWGLEVLVSFYLSCREYLSFRVDLVSNKRGKIIHSVHWGLYSQWFIYGLSDIKDIICVSSLLTDNPNENERWDNKLFK